LLKLDPNRRAGVLQMNMPSGIFARLPGPMQIWIYLLVEERLQSRLTIGTGAGCGIHGSDYRLPVLRGKILITCSTNSRQGKRGIDTSFALIKYMDWLTQHFSVFILAKL